MLHKRLILIFIIFVLFFAACDKIEGPYMLGNPNGNDTSQTIQQYVFVEYFTGHRCPNCPTAGNQLKILKDMYKERLIYISVHAGSFALPMGQNYSQTDYRTTIGNDLDSYFQVTSVSTPNGLINRKQFNNDRVIPPSSWSSMIAEELSQTPRIHIDIMQAVIENNTAKVRTKANILAELDGIYMTSMYIVEDSIQSYQKNSNVQVGPVPDIPDYMHRYVLRGSMNGTWGDTLCTGSLSQGQSFEREFSMNLVSEWNVNRLYVVCFIYNKHTDEVVQVGMKRFVK